MNQSLTYNQLNEFIQVIINSNGIQYVVDNYINLREDYYTCKQT